MVRRWPKDFRAVERGRADLCDATNRPATQPTGPLRDELAVRQAVLTNADVLTPGRALVLGSLDTPGSTRHLEIGVVLELVK